MYNTSSISRCSTIHCRAVSSSLGGIRVNAIQNESISCRIQYTRHPINLPFNLLTPNTFCHLSNPKNDRLCHSASAFVNTPTLLHFTTSVPTQTPGDENQSQASSQNTKEDASPKSESDRKRSGFNRFMHEAFSGQHDHKPRVQKGFRGVRRDQIALGWKRFFPSLGKSISNFKLYLTQTKILVKYSFYRSRDVFVALLK